MQFHFVVKDKGSADDNGNNADYPDDAFHGSLCWWKMNVRI